MANKLIIKSATSSLSSDYNYTTDYATRVKITRVTITFSADYNKTVDIFIDSSLGSNYDSKLYSQKMKKGNSFVLLQDIILNVNDELKVSIEAKSGVTAYIAITGEHI